MGLLVQSPIPKLKSKMSLLTLVPLVIYYLHAIKQQSSDPS